VNRHIPVIIGLVCIALLSGCAQTARRSEYDYSTFRAEDPKSILVIPAINRSVQIDAPDLFLSTISRPVAERGYYVFPVHMVKRILEDDGLADADMVHQQDTVRLASLVGADAVLYVVIEQWSAKYVVFSTTVTVEISYVLKSGKTGQELWSSKVAKAYNTDQGNSSGNPLADLIAGAIVAAIEKANPNYIPLTKQANADATNRPHFGLPAGPYHGLYNEDIDTF